MRVCWRDTALGAQCLPAAHPTTAPLRSSSSRPPALCLRCHMIGATDFVACEGNVETIMLLGVVAVQKGAQRCSLPPRPTVLCCAVLPPSLQFWLIPPEFLLYRQKDACVLRSVYSFAACVVTSRSTWNTLTPGHGDLPHSLCSCRQPPCVDPPFPFSHSPTWACALFPVFCRNEQHCSERPRHVCLDGCPWSAAPTGTPAPG